MRQNRYLCPGAWKQTNFSNLPDLMKLCKYVIFRPNLHIDSITDLLQLTVIIFLSLLWIWAENWVNMSKITCSLSGLDFEISKQNHLIYNLGIAFSLLLAAFISE